MPSRHQLPRGEEAQSNRAVSPVIGVILMVAITVILAAVIGAFVLEIGDQQETAPNTSFDSDQSTLLYKNINNGDKRNETQVDISHAGGDVLGISQTQIKVNGNASTWDMEEGEHPSSNAPPVHPQPNVNPTLGTNERVDFSSGQTWEVSLKNGLNFDNLEEPNEYVVFLAPTAPTPIDGNPVQIINVFGGCCSGNQQTNADPLEQGDNVNIVWTASSGGKTQTLFKYTVQ
jgi:flagellin-like protein